MLIFISAIFFSCKDAAIPDPYSVGSVSIDYNSISPVYEIDFGSDDELDITLSGTFSGQDMFLVKMNSNNSVINSESAGYVKSENFSRSLMSSDTEILSGFESIIPFKTDHLESMNFLDLYKPEEYSAIFVPSRSIAPEKEDSIVNNKDYVVGNTELFWVEDTPGNFIEIEAILRAQGEYSNIWISDNRPGDVSNPIYNNYDSGSSSDIDNKLNDTDITNLAATFNGTDPLFDDSIYELVTNVFGYEYGGGSGGDGGKDGDKHVNILIYDIDYDASPTQPGGVFGYFWGKDYYDDTLAQSWNPPLRSNESEIFYIDSYFLDKFQDSMYSTLAHEFQHMIHFNRKFIEKGLSSATWYNEMLSMLSEDIMQDKLDISDLSSPISRSSDFVDGYYKSGITDWLGGEDVYYSYASSFMFGAFITRNFGGASLIKAMLDSDSVNQTSVTDALATAGYGSENSNSVFNKYSTELIYSTEDSLNNILVTNKNSSVFVDPNTYNQKAFDIYDYANSNSYNGPVVFYADYKLALRPLGMSIHSDDPWFNLTGTQTLRFDIVSPASGVKYYLMFR